MTQQTQAVVQEVGSLIDKLAAKLSVPAAHLWEVLTRQAQTDAVGAFVGAALWVVVACAVAYGVTKLVRMFDEIEASYQAKYAAYRAEKERNVYANAPTDPDVGGERAAVRILRFVSVGVCLLFAVNSAMAGWQKLANPEYYALREVLAVLK